ncbi:MAG: zinc ABC transporter substrate-binding protein, partial [Phycisphaerales bacterium]|nr:zinc ABC transporter substrate-binding protein [Phycisphaerales bacterium]
YFGRAYGIEVRGIQGISTESEAGLNEINALVDFLVQRRIKAVFVESSVSSRNIQAIREGCRARGHEVALGGELYSDAMGPPDHPEGTYEGMVKHNVRMIVEALR